MNVPSILNETEIFYLNTILKSKKEFYDKVDIINRFNEKFVFLEGELKNVTDLDIDCEKKHLQHIRFYRIDKKTNKISEEPIGPIFRPDDYISSLENNERIEEACIYDEIFISCVDGYI